MTKEQLFAENTILKEDNKRLREQEEKLRRDVSKVLGNYRTKNEMWTGERETELVVYSWAEIFAELGKLLAAKTFYDITGNVSEQEEQIKNIHKSIEQLYKERIHE